MLALPLPSANFGIVNHNDGVKGKFLEVFAQCFPVAGHIAVTKNFLIQNDHFKIKTDLKSIHFLYKNNFILCV